MILDANCNFKSHEIVEKFKFLLTPNLTAYECHECLNFPILIYLLFNIFY